MARTAEQAAEVLKFYATHTGPVFAAARMFRLADMRELQAAADHANRLDYKGQARQRHDGDPSKTLRYNPYLCGRIEDPERPFDYVADFKAMKLQRGVIERKGTAPVSHFLFIISPHWVAKTGEVHDPDNPRNQKIFEGAIKWAGELFGADSVLSARMDMDELGGGMVDLFVCPTAKHKKRDKLSISPRLLKLQEQYQRSKSFQAVQDSIAEFAQKHLDSAIQRGKEKEGQRGNDYLTPDNFAAQQANMRECDRLEELARDLQAKEQEIEVDTERLAQREAESAIAHEEVEARLAARERDLAKERDRMSKREVAVAVKVVQASERERNASTKEARSRMRDHSARGLDLRATSRETANQREGHRLEVLRTKLDAVTIEQRERARALAKAEAAAAKAEAALTEMNSQRDKDFARKQALFSGESQRLLAVRNQIGQDRKEVSDLKEKAARIYAEAQQVRKAADVDQQEQQRRLQAERDAVAAIKSEALIAARRAEGDAEEARIRSEEEAQSRARAFDRVAKAVFEGDIIGIDKGSGNVQLAVRASRTMAEIDRDFASAGPVAKEFVSHLLSDRAKAQAVGTADVHVRIKAFRAAQIMIAADTVVDFDDQARKPVFRDDIDDARKNEFLEAVTRGAPFTDGLVPFVINVRKVARENGRKQGFAQATSDLINAAGIVIRALLDRRLEVRKQPGATSPTVEFAKADDPANKDLERPLALAKRTGMDKVLMLIDEVFRKLGPAAGQIRESLGRFLSD